MKSLVEMQKDYPSVVELLFEQAIRRLKRVVKVRKEAIDYYHSHFGGRNPKGLQENRKSTGGNKVVLEEKEEKLESSKLMASKNATLKQIEEIDESGTESSHESEPRNRLARKRTKAKTSMTRIKFRSSM